MIKHCGKALFWCSALIRQVIMTRSNILFMSSNYKSLKSLLNCNNTLFQNKTKNPTDMDKYKKK